MPTTFVVPTIFTAVDKFTGPLSKLSGATSAFANRAEVSMARAERGFRSLMAPLTGLRNMMNNIGYYVGIYTFIRAMRQAFNVVADFEQAQVDIAAVTNKSISHNKELADRARVLAIRYGEAASSVMGLNLAMIKLGFTESQGVSLNQLNQISEAVLKTSIALRTTDVEDVGQKIGSILTAFSIDKTQVGLVGDLLAKAADLSALDWSSLSTMLPTAIKSADIAWDKEGLDPIEKLKRILAMFAAVRNAQVHVASGSTAIKNILMKSVGQYGISETELLQKIFEAPNQLKKAYKLVGPKSLVSALPLAEAQASGFTQKFIDDLTKGAPGYTESISSKRLNSMRGSLKLLGTAYDEFILSFESGEGKLSKTISGLLQITRTMFLLGAGTEQAREQIAKMPQTIVDTANQWASWLSLIWDFIKLFVMVKALLISMRLVLFAVTASQWLWNAALAVTGFMHKKNLVALLTSWRGLLVYNIATRAVAIGQTLMNVAMWASPLVLFAVGILAIVGGMKLLNSWMDSAVNGINAYSSAMDVALDKHEKFYMEEQNPFADPNSPYRQIDPAGASKFDMWQKQKAIEQMQSQQNGFFSDKFNSGFYDLKEKVNNRFNGQEEGFRASQMNGTIKLEIDDKGNYVKKVRSDNVDILPVVSGSQAEWMRKVQEQYGR